MTDENTRFGPVSPDAPVAGRPKAVRLLNEGVLGGLQAQALPGVIDRANPSRWRTASPTSAGCRRRSRTAPRRIARLFFFRLQGGA
ncbi:MAG: hypothetical protein ACI3ZE_00470 [Candidatus Woodwardiibium sp.]